MAKGNGKKTKPAKPPQGITHITVGGYKSIAREQTIEIRPLTVLAGANSSGKSSMMQPLLLLKQTLEAPYDPGALKLDGPNVNFTSIDQLVARGARRGLSGNSLLDMGVKATVDVAPGATEGVELRLVFNHREGKQLDLHFERFIVGGKTTELMPGMSPDDIMTNIGLPSKFFRTLEEKRFKCSVLRNRCFLEVPYEIVDDSAPLQEVRVTVAHIFSPLIQQLIHLPGLRGSPERLYPVAAIGASFPGRFENYTASILTRWASEVAAAGKLKQLCDDLFWLGLTWKIQTKPINDIQVEIKVARLPKPSRRGVHDLVNIADVGFGVSQTLPVLVALLVAEPGQLVYLEQPEIHLHPRAQVAMAQLLANAANRGVKVVVETHSSLVLLGIESLVAEGKLSKDNVILHWFARDNEGNTSIRTGELDFAGRSGDWPEDFGDVSLETQRRYLDAVDRRVAP